MQDSAGPMTMQKLLAITAFIVVAPTAVAGQSSTAEQEVRAFIAAYDRSPTLKQLQEFRLQIL